MAKKEKKKIKHTNNSTVNTNQRLNNTNPTKNWG